MNVPFRDRQQAGQVLAANLEHYCDNSAVIVLALPRGGVPVGFEVARALRAPLDVFIVRKLGFPGHEEYAMGAIATGGVRVTNPDLREFQVPRSAVDAVTAREQEELERRERLYRGDLPPLILSKRIVILVDDGLATGSTMRAAATAVKHQDPSRVAVAVPVAAPETCAEFRAEVDEVVCGFTPEPFSRVGADEVPKTYAAGMWRWLLYLHSSISRAAQLLEERFRMKYVSPSLRVGRRLHHEAKATDKRTGIAAQQSLIFLRIPPR